MNPNQKRPYLTDPVVKTINNLCWKIWKRMGPGLEESIYKKALALELEDANLLCKREVHIDVFYRDNIVGNKFIDLLVDNRIIVEAKATSGLIPSNFAQLRTYLKAADFPYGILVNFGSYPLQFKIVVKEYVKVDND